MLPRQKPKALGGLIATPLTCVCVDWLPNCSSPIASWHPTRGVNFVAFDHGLKFFANRIELFLSKSRTPYFKLLGIRNLYNLPTV